MKLVKYLVVLGIDTDKKPHAAKFDMVAEKAVRKAAALMELRVGKPKGSEADKVVNKLPDGKLFGSGRGLVPFVRADLYEELLKVLEIEPVALAIAKADVAAPVDPWAALKPGSVVLCRDPLPEPSWWECVVVSIGRDNHTLVVRWQNYGALAPFKVKRSAVGLIPEKR